jgi:tetraacyldisaccharide 4'-kinase
VCRNKVIFTTEKDAMRLQTPEFREAFYELPIYYIPIEIRFHGDEQNEFDTLITEYVEENKRHG